MIGSFSTWWQASFTISFISWSFANSGSFNGCFSPYICKQQSEVKHRISNKVSFPAESLCYLFYVELRSLYCRIYGNTWQLLSIARWCLTNVSHWQILEKHRTDHNKRRVLSTAHFFCSVFFFSYCTWVFNNFIHQSSFESDA